MPALVDTTESLLKWNWIFPFICCFFLYNSTSSYTFCYVFPVWILQVINEARNSISINLSPTLRKGSHLRFRSLKLIIELPAARERIIAPSFTRSYGVCLILLYCMLNQEFFVPVIYLLNAYFRWRLLTWWNSIVNAINFTWGSHDVTVLRRIQT